MWLDYYLRQVLKGQCQDKLPVKGQSKQTVGSKSLTTYCCLLKVWLQLSMVNKPAWTQSWDHWEHSLTGMKQVNGGLFVNRDYSIEGI